MGRWRRSARTRNCWIAAACTQACGNRSPAPPGPPPERAVTRGAVPGSATLPCRDLRHLCPRMQGFGDDGVVVRAKHAPVLALVEDLLGAADGAEVATACQRRRHLPVPQALGGP